MMRLRSVAALIIVLLWVSVGYAATPLFLESGTSATFGFEFWVGTAGSVASDSGTTFGGNPRSIKLPANTSGSGVTGPNVYVSNTGRTSFWLNIPSYATDATYRFMYLSQSDGERAFELGVKQTTGELQLFDKFFGQLGSDGQVIPTNTWTRIAISVKDTGTAYNINVFQDGTNTIGVTGATRFSGINKVQFLDANVNTFISDVYVDDGGDLADPGAIRVTAKLPTTANANNFDTTVGTGAVNERPLSTTNGMEQAGSTQVSQNYAIQAAATGDVDISSATLVARSAWIFAKGAAGGSGTPKITNNGTDTAITLTSAGVLFTNLVASATYPSNAATIGMVSTGTTDDTFLYECGMLIAYIPSAGVTIRHRGRIL